MQTIVCPYCECKVRMTAVDAEGGACPECGAPITGSLLLSDKDNILDDFDEEDLLEGDDNGTFDLDDDDDDMEDLDDEDDDSEEDDDDYR